MTAAGRPRKIESPEAFDELVDAYVAQCVVDEKPITWTGMALALGFYGRQELMNYANYGGFSDSVKRARTIVESAYESRLHGNSPTGAIFALKNMGWSDKQEMEHTGKDGGPIKSEAKLDLSDLSTEERRALRPILERRAEQPDSGD